MAKIRVLIIDDSLVIRGMLTSIFERDDQIRVAGVAASAGEADEILAKKPVDVVTLDITMPGMDGFEYLPSLVRRHLPTVIVSSATSPGSPESEMASARGAFASFHKEHLIRDARYFLQCVKDAAEQERKTPRPLGRDPPAIDPVREGPATATEQLIAEHGDGLTIFIAERIAQATVGNDSAGLARWQSLSRKLEAILNARKFPPQTV
ncbi:Response regulator receiver domain-containing protein [Sphingomonas sp. YR710]|jgi:chemotaxis response regulator CheB|uniref:response regulator n=1 Tax=Sphingomonas sp. YR710 TaxID=1882773 RepID=UPI00088F2105|nr:response regulator [Sphingomonas sp. YR710]SDC09511.1 Response regulator receiver domain-containing protein [Sphingomonas sp. YR710]